MSETNGKTHPMFRECHQFKGVSGNPNLELPSYLDAATADMLRRPPPYTRDTSLHFSNGFFFDIQDIPDIGQYLVLPAEPGMDLARRQMVKTGEWICQLHSGRYIKLTNREAQDLGVEESPFVPCPPYPGQDPKYDYTRGGKPFGAPPGWFWTPPR